MTGIIRRKDVQHLTGLSKSTLYLEIQQGRFPLPIKIARRAVGWRMSDIEAWLKSRQPATRNLESSGEQLTGERGPQ